MHTKIVGFHQDEECAWVAELSCGHTQHVRHAPPWELREWVTTDVGRRDMLGSELDCLFCEMAILPAGLVAYKETPAFSESSVPEALLRDHRTKPGVWAQIVVETGRLEYTCDRGSFVLKPGVLGVIEPDTPHHVRTLGSVRFHVVFMRAGALQQNDVDEQR